MDEVNAMLSVRLSVRLAEIEREARNGEPLLPDETLMLVSILRKYMAHAEDVKRMMKRMENALGITE